ncbi:MAG: stage II sporulation protein M, partial [Lactobacillaceae bacterium]|nr:stage II sporulation protein M [Lactobacillaceae bacterium]
IDKIWRHGLIEIPTVFLYQLTSLKLLYIWWKNKKIITIKKYYIENWKLYFLITILIVVAGIIEGIKWQK